MSTTDLTPAVSGERRETARRSGRLSYYVAGEGAPLLLIHSINAAASAYEMRPLHERLATSRRVYTVDLPGYGFSDRSARTYDIRLFTNAVLDMVDVIREAHGPRAIDAVALSLSCEFLARAAREVPDAFASLAFVTPTGFAKGSHRKRGTPETSMRIPGMRGFLNAPWGRGLYRLLTSERSIRYFLQRTFGRKDVPAEMVAYDWRSTRQPGAEHAPFAFLSGELFARDVRDLYEDLDLPIYVLHGTKGDFRDFSEANWAIARKNWLFSAFDTGALVHWEKPEEFLGAYERFLAEVGGIRAAAS
ncbi:alpha/beta fold hydrolase [Salinarimonas ramus]|uniref:Alpha/beta hydrolase n=1 Tax=Salinarimonas ramus TaxID=690164 RepID=A0A917Q686_9HYPH|nr:alpha/beta hydrolase [Salinarimonas ramus]GGK21694.1 alpha/beta hydrolase [Salinarimonas ramus]